LARLPLARFLGAAADGVIEYQYADVVKLAGHSCPTVASAYLMTRAALNALYPDALPVRGEVRVEMRDDQAAGATGVVANVASFLTGATADGGFKGIGGHFDRRKLLFFDAGIGGQLRFTRADSGAAVSVSARLDRVPPDPRVALLLPKCLNGVASTEETVVFQWLWQGRVRTLLLDCAEDPEIIVVQH
jgi:formylmethanofuran dehydrogenase subunit E